MAAAKGLVLKVNVQVNMQALEAAADALEEFSDTVSTTAADFRNALANLPTVEVEP